MAHKSRSAKDKEKPSVKKASESIQTIRMRDVCLKRTHPREKNVAVFAREGSDRLENTQVRVCIFNT